MNRGGLVFFTAIQVGMVVTTASLRAADFDTTTGLTLMQPASARASAMAEAFSAVSNDIAAYGYNPASLGTLERGQASFLFQRGDFDDSFGQFLVGTPLRRGGWGLSVSYFNEGEVTLSNGSTSETVSAQKDLAVSAGAARRMGPVSVGFAAKYITSELIESVSATAEAVDIGMSAAVHPRAQMGLALQNMGTRMKYVTQEFDLPRVARAGLNILLFSKSLPTTLLLETPYYLNDRTVQPAMGLEVRFGPVAFRSGFKQAGHNNSFSLGAGFLIADSSFDYAFSMANDTNSFHRASLSLHFGKISR